MKHSQYAGGKDEELIELFTQTFTDSEGEAEGKTIGRFVADLLTTTPKEDIHVFVTTSNDQLIGSLIFTRIRFENPAVNTWILSPMAVTTTAQGTGVGQGLIRLAHDHLKKQGVETVVTYGDIRFYSKVGYQPITEALIPAPLTLSYPEGWIAQSLTENPIAPISGKSYCVEALMDPALW